MRPALQRAVATALESDIASASPASGGCISEALVCELDDGRRIFVKSVADADPRVFPCEARGLAWLADARALRIPAVLAVSDDDSETPFLVLEYLEPGRRAGDHDERLGRGLAALHASGAPSFGLDHDNFLATLEQDNTPEDSWPTFYAARRLEPQVRRAVDDGRAPPSWIRRFGALFEVLPERCGPPEPPARVHGDLWSGNLHVDDRGAPALLDPAVYGGHREIDLAMLALFGSPGPRVLSAYDEVHPRAPGHEERILLHQLYPLLAHVNLFGGSYVDSVDRALGRLL